MKLSIIAEDLIEFFALLSGRIPLPLLELYYSMGISSSLVSALRLGIFDLIRKGYNTPESIAKKKLMQIKEV